LRLSRSTVWRRRASSALQGIASEGAGVCDDGVDHGHDPSSWAPPAAGGREIARQFAESQSRADETTDRAVKWLERPRKPFFLLVHYYDPHTPYDPPAEFRGRWPQNPYLGEVAFTDGQLARLLESASRAAGGGNLIAAIVADHGEGLGQHKESQHGIFVYDSTLRVPFILHAPGRVSEGLVVGDQVSTIDLAPTVLGLAGVPAPDTWQGRSLAEEVIAARKLLGVGDEDGAKEHLKRALDLNPNDPDALSRPAATPIAGSSGRQSDFR
jgi:arylsulfatase A-like enzyme